MHFNNLVSNQTSNVFVEKNDTEIFTLSYDQIDNAELVYENAQELGPCVNC